MIAPQADPALLRSTLEILDQGILLLSTLDDTAYRRRFPSAYNGSIGGHYRHTLDHFSNLLAAATTGTLDYDQRQRHTPVELDVRHAAEVTRDLRHGFLQLDPRAATRALFIRSLTSTSETDPATVVSSFGRELMYCVAHAIHHFALIGILANLSGIPVPAGFGLAPSTARFQESTPPATPPEPEPLTPLHDQTHAHAHAQ